MTTTNQLFNLIDKYLFAFKSKEDVIKYLFNNDLKPFYKKDIEEVEKIVYSNLIKYFRKQFEAKRLSVLIKKYIKANKIKKLTENDLTFIDNILIESEYELSFDDLEKISNIKEIKEYLENHKNDETLLVEKLNELISIEKEAEVYDNSVDANYIDGDLLALYKKDFKNFDVLTPEEERYYLKKYLEENDEEAFNKLVYCNQGLCVKVAGKYQNRGVGLLDLIQEANIGLMKSLEKFDLSRETKLSTYAMWWIEQYIKNAIKYHGRTIRIPVHIYDALEKMDRIEAAYEREYGITPTIKELAELTGFSEKKIEYLKNHNAKILSIDKQVQTDEDNGSTLGEFLKSDLETPEEYEDKLALRDLLEGYFERLMHDPNEKNPKRAVQIIRLRFGYELYNEESFKLIKKANLELKDGYILEDVGKMLGITRERVRQIENQTIHRFEKYANILPQSEDLNDEKEKKKK